MSEPLPVAEPIAARASGPVLSRRHDDGSVQITFELSDFLVFVTVKGRGTMAGAEAMIGFLDDAVRVIGTPKELRLLVDVSGNTGAPLRSQLLFGRWFMAHRKWLGAAAIVGASSIERGMATALCKVTRIKNMRFFDGTAEALAWLDTLRS